MCRQGPPCKLLASSLTAIGLTQIAVISLGPLLFESYPRRFLGHWPPLTALLTKLIVVLPLMAAIGIGAWVDRTRGRGGFFLASAFMLVAAMLTTCHWLLVEGHYRQTDHRNYYVLNWQRDLYLAVLNGSSTRLADGSYTVPHVYRPLPYGFTRALELVVHNWLFACFLYRWFFTYWTIWAFYQFARIFRSPGQALLVVLAYAILYPWSVKYYEGQLTDPLSHALFALSLIYTVEGRSLALAGSLFLGMLAKETVAIVVVADWACHWRQGWRALCRSSLLAAACAAAFLATRLPLGWRLDLGVNGTPLNVLGNLGIGPMPSFPESIWYENYLQPLLFVGVFIPFIAMNWKKTESELKALFVTLTPLLLGSSLLFGWLYESRNFVPLLPVIVTMALPRREPGS
jgi:hypothetical protein